MALLAWSSSLAHRPAARPQALGPGGFTSTSQGRCRGHIGCVRSRLIDHGGCVTRGDISRGDISVRRCAGPANRYRVVRYRVVANVLTVAPSTRSIVSLSL